MPKNLPFQFILGRSTTRWQFCGAALMVLSILLAKAGDLNSESQTVPPTAILIAAFASVNSVAASIFTEVQLKGKDSTADETSFLEKQFWLYLYGSAVALVGHLGNDSGYLPHHFVQDISGKRIRFSPRLRWLFSSLLTKGLTKLGGRHFLFMSQWLLLCRDGLDGDGVLNNIRGKKYV